MECEMCGCQEFSLLGTLGQLTWYRCRACGFETAETKPEILMVDDDIKAMQDKQSVLDY